MEPQNSSTPPGQNQDPINTTGTVPGTHSSALSTGKALTLLFVILVIAGLIYGYQMYRTASRQVQVQDTPKAQEVKAGYSQISDKLQFAENDPDLVEGLSSLRDIAADPNNTPADRARALNGISYAYQSTDFDAQSIYNAVFAQAPFNQYYTPSGAASGTPDTLRPFRSGDVQGVENAIEKLMELSYQLAPNPYAIVRQEVFLIFAFQREIEKTPKAQQQAVIQKYADQIKPLVTVYDSLPPIENSDTSYSEPMRLQTMFAQAGVLAWLGNNLNDKSYQDKGEAAFQHVVQVGDDFVKTHPTSDQSRGMVMLARIFYASYYWPHYYNTDPKKIEDVIRPVITDSKGTTVDSAYLPGLKDSKVPPATRLRNIAKQMPELKAYLQAKGWTF